MTHTSRPEQLHTLVSRLERDTADVGIWIRRTSLTPLGPHGLADAQQRLRTIRDATETLERTLAARAALAYEHTSGPPPPHKFPPR